MKLTPSWSPFTHASSHRLKANPVVESNKKNRDYTIDNILDVSEAMLTGPPSQRTAGYFS